MTKTTNLLTSACLLLAILLQSCTGCNQKTNNSNDQKKEIHVLAWVGYDEDEIVKPFETDSGIKVFTETFTGADKMFAKLSQNPDAYDVVVIDPEYISKLNNAGLLSDLDKKDFDFSSYIEPLKDFSLCTIDGKFKAVLVRFGVNGLVYNTEKLTKEDVSSYKILWNKKVTGKVGMWDWYLPNMGVLSLSQGLNQTNPYQLDPLQFDTLKSALLKLKPQVKAVMGAFSDINAAFARGDIWVAPALGEHTASILAGEGHPISWTVPKEGGVMWIETLGIPKQAKNRESAIKYIHYLQSPEVEAKLTWRKAYRSNIPSVKAIELLNDTQKDALKVHNAEEATNLVNSIKVRMLPTDKQGNSQEKVWQDAWQTFKTQ